MSVSASVSDSDLYEHTSAEHAVVITALLRFAADLRRDMERSPNEDQIQAAGLSLAAIEQLLDAWTDERVATAGPESG